MELYDPVWCDVTFPLLNFSVLSETEIKHSISKLQTKSCELDLVTTKILKENLDNFINAITHIVNLSIQDGQFDDDWKCAVLRPLMKKLNGPSINNNYRPVGNLPFISKLLEKCEQDQFVNHNVNLCLNSEFQSAYRPGHSCETTLLKIMKNLLWAMERQSVSVLILLDLSVAFDTVDHQVLLNILERKFGIKDVALKWFKSYLQKRGFRVCVNDAYLTRGDIDFSIPQGSINGPVLFNAYFSTIRSVTDLDITVNVFADDHSLQKEFIPHLEQEIPTNIQLESNLVKVENWMSTNRLKLNPSKTEFVLFGSKVQL